jgi:antitoxin VapB
MGVQLNIKDEQTVELARELAKKLGKSVTETVREALEEKKRRREAEIEGIVADIDEITRGLEGHWNAELDGFELSTRHGELLYDDDGLAG